MRLFDFQGAGFRMITKLLRTSVGLMKYLCLLILTIYLLILTPYTLLISEDYRLPVALLAANSATGFFAGFVFQYLEDARSVPNFSTSFALLVALGSGILSGTYLVVDVMNSFLNGILLVLPLGFVLLFLMLRVFLNSVLSKRLMEDG